MSAIDRKSAQRTERRKLRDLVPFPMQSQYFGDLPKHELAALANDIERNGLRQMPEILPTNIAGLPANTIISGHQRLRALRRLGNTATDVLVRYDLADAPLAQITRAFLEPNANRRQLSMLAKARVAQALFASERGKQENDLSDSELSSARDRVGLAIGVSGRHLDRFMRILRTPLEVQAAVEAGILPIVMASQVANLKTREQVAIAKALADGAEPRPVVEEYMRKERRDNVGVRQELRLLFRGLQRLPAIIERLDETSAYTLRNNLPLLEPAIELLPLLIHRATRQVSVTNIRPEAPPSARCKQ